MDGAGHEFLAGAGFADHEHGRRRRRDASHQLVHVQHALALAFDFGHLVSRGGRRSGVRLGRQTAAFECARHRQAQLFDVERLRDVVVGAVANGFHGASNITESGDQNDRRSRGFLREGAQHVQAAHALHAHVRQHEIVAPLAGALDGRATVVDGFHLEAFASQNFAEKVAGDGIVLDHQQATHDVPPVAILREPDSNFGPPVSASAGPASGR